ncbi:unnamed protein product [Phytophthora fragariaefolia]|uniref:Unnamed protein product n=1 Tax=Phytophthora fragariaefolia TaxID=1490495 RepID=A0A9W7DA38_9STRA|nr:unnamed protein product [Phytophthora fragariaefolia]
MENDVTTARMKHINIKFHFIRDAIRKEGIQIRYCPTTEMKADILTKPLGGILHNRNVAMLKLISPDTKQQQNVWLDWHCRGGVLEIAAGVACDCCSGASNDLKQHDDSNSLHTPRYETNTERAQHPCIKD